MQAHREALAPLMSNDPFHEVARIWSRWCSQRAVLPSLSVERNGTVPLGRAGMADLLPQPRTWQGTDSRGYRATSSATPQTQLPIIALCGVQASPAPCDGSAYDAALPLQQTSARHPTARRGAGQ